MDALGEHSIVVKSGIVLGKNMDTAIEQIKSKDKGIVRSYQAGTIDLYIRPWYSMSEIMKTIFI